MAMSDYLSVLTLGDCLSNMTMCAQGLTGAHSTRHWSQFKISVVNVFRFDITYAGYRQIDSMRSDLRSRRHLRYAVQSQARHRISYLLAQTVEDAVEATQFAFKVLYLALVCLVHFTQIVALPSHAFI